MNKGEHRRADVVGRVMAQVSLKAALKKWGKEAEESVGKEMKQLHWRNCFKPVHYKSLTPEQRKQVLESHIFVERKRDGVLKARTVAGGNKQRGYILKEDASSPTVSSEAVMLTCTIDAKEKREVAVVDIPNAFVQTVIEDEKDRSFIRIRGPLVDILTNIAPDVYGEYVTIGKNGDKVLLVQCLNALYGTMVASLLYYKKFVKSLKSKGFKLNPYDPCVANKQVEGKQLTVCFHVDDCKISHISTKVVDDTIDWLRSEYENVFEDGSGLMKVHRGKIHKYLGMTLDFSHVNQCRITMIDYVDEIIAAYDKSSSELDDGFTRVIKKGNRSKSSAAPDDLFVVNEDAEKLSEVGQTAFHHLVYKTLYISKRARPDLSTAIAFLTTRVQAPDIDDWRKLSHMVEYLRVDRLRPLILSADSSGVLMWYVDASFAVHPNMRSHTGGGLTMGRGFPIVTSTKQKLNTRSSTESELVGVDDMMPIVVWSRYFLISQGYGVTQNLLLQDNQSSMLLEKNGKASSGKRTRHINIRYYFVTNRVNMKEIEIEWCPTKDMVADFMTKPLQGSHFRRLRDLIMGMTKVEKSKSPKKDVSK
jgi:Reverse transcriptase (RNA-dependent DNA polymerase)